MAGEFEDKGLHVAMAQRARQEHIWTMNVFRRAIGKPMVQEEAAVTRLFVDTNSALFDQLLGESVPFLDAFDFTDLVYAKLNNQAAQGSLTCIPGVEPQSLAQAIDPTGKIRLISSMSLNTFELQAMRDRSKLLAEDKSTSPMNIFLEEAYFDDLVRAEYTPHSFAERTLSYLPYYGVKDLGRGLLEQKRKYLRPMTDQEFEELVARNLESSRFYVQAKPTVDQVRVGAQAVLVNNLVRFWGEDFLCELPWDTQDMIEEMGQPLMPPPRITVTAISLG